MKTKKENVSFSIELLSRNQIKRAILPDGSGDKLTLEGYLGELESVELIEDVLLEIKGSTGILRVGLSREVLVKGLKKK